MDDKKKKWEKEKKTMKKTTVTPRATFDQIPSPNHKRKIGASTTLGSEFAIRM